jgi:hypothetical protein
MTAVSPTHERRNPIIAGVILITIGAIAWAVTASDIDPSRWLGGSGWTLFILIPGLILFVGGLLSHDEPAQGLTIAGAIVMTVAAMLFVMDRTEHYEAWAYAWALIPGAAGLGVLVHGLRTGDRERVGTALRLMGISLALLLVGAWFFETIFQTGTVPFGLETFWPFMLVVLGVVVIAGAFLRPGATGRTPKV